MNTPYQLDYGIHQSPPTWRLFAIDNLIELNLLYFIICMKLALDHLIELNFKLFHYLYIRVSRTTNSTTFSLRTIPTYKPTINNQQQ